MSHFPLQAAKRAFISDRNVFQALEYLSVRVYRPDLPAAVARALSNQYQHLGSAVDCGEEQETTAILRNCISLYHTFYEPKKAPWSREKLILQERMANKGTQVDEEKVGKSGGRGATEAQRYVWCIGVLYPLTFNPGCLREKFVRQICVVAAAEKQSGHHQSARSARTGDRGEVAACV